MNDETVRLLSRTTADFYRRVSASFSQTRANAWPGWSRCAEIMRAYFGKDLQGARAGLRVADVPEGRELRPIQELGSECAESLADEACSARETDFERGLGFEHGTRLVQGASCAYGRDPAHEAEDPHPVPCPSPSFPFCVLDMACGNLRFERFLEGEFPQTTFGFFACDNCEPLVAEGSPSALSCNVTFANEDLIEALLQREARTADFTLIEDLFGSSRKASHSVAHSWNDHGEGTTGEGFAVDAAVRTGYALCIKDDAGVGEEAACTACGVSKENAVCKGDVVRAACAACAEGADSAACDADTDAAFDADADAAGEPVFADGARFPVIVSFGFLHHIPSYRLRVRFVRELLAAAQPGGLVFLSFWRFGEDARLLSKARQGRAAAVRQLPVVEAELEENDYLLGWQETSGAFRYCHHFSEQELRRLQCEVLEGSSACLLASFDADGKSGNLNRYLVFRA